MRRFTSFVLGLSLTITASAEVAFVSTDTNDQITRIGANHVLSAFIATGLNNPSGVLFDRAGVAYIANYGTGSADGTVLKFAGNGNPPVTMASGLNGPTGLAFDGDGVLYAAVSQDNRIIKITAPGTFTTYAQFDSGSNPQGIVFAPSGDLYVANKGANNIGRMSAAGNRSIFSVDVIAPTGVAVDSAGDLFALSLDGHANLNGSIVRFNPHGKSMVYQSGFNDPRALAVDGQDDFFVVNGATNSLVRIAAAPSKAVTTFASSLADPRFVAVRSPIIEKVAGKGDDAVIPTGGAKFAVLGQPAIGTSAVVTYRASLVVAGTVASTNSAGIWRDGQDGTRALLARASYPAPGVDGQALASGALFASFSDPVTNGSGKVAFRAKLKSGDSLGRAFGIWSDAGGALALVARQGDLLTGDLAGAKFTAFTSLFLPDTGTPVFLANFSGPGVSSVNNSGLWAAAPGGAPQLLLRKGDPIMVGTATLKIVSFSALRPVPISVGQSRSVAQDTGVTVLALLSDGNSAILRVRNGVTEVVARKHDLLAIAPLDAKLASLFSPALSGNGDVVWRGALAPDTTKGINKSNAMCLFRDSAARVRTLIARAGSTPAPGTDSAQFASFADPVTNSAGQMAFRGTLRVGIGDAVLANKSGLWAESGGTLNLVARQGLQAPGLSNGVTFTSFSSFVLTDAGGLVARATVAGPGISAPNNSGLWAVDKDGVLEHVLLVGDKIRIDGALKAVSALKTFLAQPTVAGQGRNYAGDGNLAFQATFSDLTVANLRVVFP